MSLSDRAVSILRTVVPSLWGSAILFVTANLALPEPLVEYLGSEATVAVVTALAITGWYAVWRTLEPQLPAWLTRIVLGSNQAPSYPVPPAPAPAPELAPEVEDALSEPTVQELTDAEIVAARRRIAGQ